MATKYPSIRIEGGFLAADLLVSIAEGSASGQAPRDFGFPDKTSLLDQISAAWSDARSYWSAFERRAAQLKDGETGTTFTRNQWMVPMFGVLGFEHTTFQEKASEVDGGTYAISHRAGSEPDSPPIHIIGAGQSIDKRSESGRPRLAPHSLVQEYLNRTEHVWGMVTNGLMLRLLRNSQLIRRQAYLEVDLRTMFAGEGRFSDFALLYRLIHRSRFPHTYADTKSCLLERWFEHTVEQGGRVREKLREGVEKAIPRVANGILLHPRNAEMLERIRSGDLKATELYQELLRLIYRLLFLMVTEERSLLTSNVVYRERYSVSRLRRMCENRQARNSHIDLWTGLQSTFRLFHVEDFGKVLDLPPLNGDLFDLRSTGYLNDAVLSNRDFLDALWHLSLYREEHNAPPRHVNYSALDVEELGSVYEGLLELQPTFNLTDGQLTFELIPGLERKGTGSYYTAPELVEELLKSALLPVLADRLRQTGTPQEREKRLLEMSICDPACGSGHFLLAAARRLARELAKIRSGEDEPGPQYRIALRDVISHCIYGVDKNPLAVELCKVALWLESYTEAKPLSFLDHRIQLGNSLVGVRDLAAIKNGVPEDAYKPVTGDDRDVAREAKATNRRQLRLTGQMAIFTPDLDLGELGNARRELDAIPDDTPDQIRRKRVLLGQFRSNVKYEKDRRAADLWTLAFFARLTNDNVTHGIPLTDHIREAAEGRNPDPQLVAEATAEADRLFFFHWPLEFPEVFSGGGFDVLLSNPPWERIKLQQVEFFASRDLAISRAPNKAARERIIAELPQNNPVLWLEYQAALHDADCTSKFLRTSGSYPDTARGDINTYSVFAERLTRLVNGGGRIGAVVPTGIATDDTNKVFFANVATTGQLTSLFDFENRDGIFPEVHRSYKFSLVTILGSEPSTPEAAQFAFFLTQAEQLQDKQRIFPLTTDDFKLLNPNTKTCPIFRTRADAELTRRIYERVPVLIDEEKSQNPWGVKFSTMFHMSNDSDLFRTREQLEADGFHLFGNNFLRGEEIYLPLYEAKMIHQFDHRFGSFEGVTDRGNVQLPTPSEQQYADPCYVSLPWYWVEAREVYLSSASIPEGLRKAMREKDEDLTRLGLAHLLFGRWLIERAGTRRGMFHEWQDFVERFAFARTVVPTTLGICGDNPPLLSPATEDSLPAEPIDKISTGPREATAWYDADPKLLSRYLAAMAEYQLNLPTQSELPVDANTWDTAEWCLRKAAPRWSIGFRNIARSNDERTALFSILPKVAVGHSMPLVTARKVRPCDVPLLLGMFDALVFDFFVRQKLGGVNMTFGYVMQFPALPPDLYDPNARAFIIPRVLELVCSSWDVKPFLNDVWGSGDNSLREAITRQWKENRNATGDDASEPPIWYQTESHECPHPPFRWSEARRRTIRAELDAYYARLYGLTEQELRYVLDPGSIHGEGFPGESFRVLKEREVVEFGEYRTSQMVLDAWSHLG